LALELSRQELERAKKKPEVLSDDERLARQLQEEERQAAIKRAQAAQAAKSGQGSPIAGKPTVVLGQPVVTGKPIVAQPAPAAIAVMTLPPGVTQVHPPVGVKLPPHCILGSDHGVYNVAEGYRLVGKLKKK